MTTAVSEPFIDLSEEPTQPDVLAFAEAEIVRVFGEVLKVRDVRADDDFFDLGGDSLGAVTVMAFVEENFGVSVPVSAILDAATPRLLARFVTEFGIKEFSSCVIRVQDTGPGLSLFIVHGLAGDVIYARQIAKILGPTRPTYGLRAVGLRAGETPISDISEIASRYVSEMRGVQPKGPYLLHGYCGGAFVAYEIAQQLRRAGESVSGLVIVDPPLDWRRSPFLLVSGAGLSVLKWAASARLQYSTLRSVFRDKNTDTYRRVQVARTLWHALAHYEPEPYPGNALVIYCGQQRDILFNAKRGLEKSMPKTQFVEAGETHSSLFETGAQTLAETKAFIERVDPTLL